MLSCKTRVVFLKHFTSGSGLRRVWFISGILINTYRNARATVGRGGRRSEKGTCTGYDVIMTSEF